MAVETITDIKKEIIAFLVNLEGRVKMEDKCIHKLQ
jgi:hypothetical protein